MRLVLFATLGFAMSAACAAPLAVGHQAHLESEVLDALDDFMRGITASDADAQQSRATRDGMLYVARMKGDKSNVSSLPQAKLIESSRNRTQKVREQYWAPTVIVRGPIATVWAPYEFWVDDKTSHCGIDAFQFIKKDGRWLVANVVFTVEEVSACDELRPEDPATIRPPE